MPKQKIDPDLDFGHVVHHEGDDGESIVSLSPDLMRHVRSKIEKQTGRKVRVKKSVAVHRGSKAKQ